MNHTFRQRAALKGALLLVSIVVGAIWLWLFVCVWLASGQERPDAPTSKKDADMALTIAHAAALMADGITTRQFVHHGWVEIDPVTRPLIGARPTYQRMAPFAAAELVGAYWLTRRHPRVGRWVQLGLALTHAGFAAHNLTLGVNNAHQRYR